MPTIEQYERLRRTLESRSVKLMGPRSPFWRCEYCQALSQTPIGFQHKPECVIAALPVESMPTSGGPTEKHPNAPAPRSQPDIAGHTEAEGHAASLLQQAIWIEESVDGTAPPSQRLDLGDVDIDALRSAAQFIAQQADRIEELTKVAQMAKAVAELELGISGEPDFTARKMLKAADRALAPSLEDRK